jgi:hypothetical protein
MQYSKNAYWKGAEVLKLCAILSVFLASGCRGDKFTPGLQDIAIIVRAHSTAKGVAGAVVTAEFPAAQGLTDSTRQMLDYGRIANLDTAVTDALGQAAIPVRISGYPFSLGPDQITGGPMAFRVEAEKAVEYLFSGSLHVGEILAGSRFDIEIRSIGQPYKGYWAATERERPCMFIEVVSKLPTTNPR